LEGLLDPGLEEKVACPIHCWTCGMADSFGITVSELLEGI
jgi:hypothetical protein